MPRTAPLVVGGRTPWWPEPQCGRFAPAVVAYDAALAQADLAAVGDESAARAGGGDT